MDSRTRARAARVSRETLPGQGVLCPEGEEIVWVDALPAMMADPTSRELLEQILGAVEVKQ
jgi:hypothetical protein